MDFIFFLKKYIKERLTFKELQATLRPDQSNNKSSKLPYLDHLGRENPSRDRIPGWLNLRRPNLNVVESRGDRTLEGFSSFDNFVPCSFQVSLTSPFPG